MSCESVYWKKPAVLFENKSLDFIWGGCSANRFNAFFRFVLVIFVIAVVIDVVYGDFSIGGLLENTIGVVVIGLVMFGVSVLFGSARGVEEVEGFQAPVTAEESAHAFTGREEDTLVSMPGTVVTMGGRTLPSPANPFMNVLVHEVKYNPTRGSAAEVDCPVVKDTLENYYRVQWWADPTDVFGKSQGQRQFYTMPSTSIPSDRQSFQDWLYLIPGKTCKEGGRDACVPGTNGGAIPWLSQPN
jgi:hypothetical protein